MKRKRQSSEGSLDSLLDTMTNVVGILVILLAVTQMGVGDAVKRIQQIDAPLLELSPDEIKAAQADQASAQQELDELRRKSDAADVQMKIDQLALDQQQQQLDELRRDLKKVQQGKLKPEDVQKQIEERKKKSLELEEKIASASKELANLKALLDRTPQPKLPPATVIKLPNPRPAPKGIQPVVYVCRNGRVMPGEIDKLEKLALDEIRRLQRSQKKEALNSKDIAQVFERKRIDNTYFRLKFQKLYNQPYLVVEHKPNTGGTAEAVAKSGSLFQQRIRHLNKNKEYVRYLVWGDSFDAYLAARGVSDGRDLLAGWEPYDAKAPWRISLRGKVKLSDVPPPPKKKPPTKSPPGKKPPVKKPPLPVEQID